MGLARKLEVLTSTLISMLSATQPHPAHPAACLPSEAALVDQPLGQVWVAPPPDHGQAHTAVVNGGVALLSHAAQAGLQAGRRHVGWRVGEAGS